MNAQKSLIDRDSILSFFRANKDFFEQHFGITQIALFGSYARNEATPDSDIDVLIEMPLKSFQKRLELRDFLEKNFGKKVDLGYFDSVRSFIMHHVEKDLIYA